MGVLARILHVEDDSNDRELVRRQVSKMGALAVAGNRSEVLAAMEHGGFNVVLADSGVVDCETTALLEMIQNKMHGVPLILVSGRSFDDPKIQRLLADGAEDYVPKSKLDLLPQAISHCLRTKRAS